jgi:DNA-binding XRE family transcriptional regulator
MSMPTAKKRKTTTDAVEILHRRFYEGQPERLAELEKARASAAVARAAYELRATTRLSQRELARRVGVTPTLIAQLEDDDFEGDMLAFLQRIAAALDKTVEIRVVPRKAKRQAA